MGLIVGYGEDNDPTAVLISMDSNRFLTSSIINSALSNPEKIFDREMLYLTARIP